MSPEAKRQIFQSIGQFIVVFLLGMAVYKDWNAVLVIGIGNAVYQPLIQAGLSTAAIWGLSKTGPKGGSA